MSSIDDDLSQVNPLRVLYPFMFTGIIEKMGSLIETRDESYGKSITVQCIPWDSPVKRGESIALSGCCLTVTEHQLKGDNLLITFDVIPETLKVTTLGEWAEGERINIERAVTVATPLGGHIVQGHVDYTTSVKSIKQSDGEHVISLSVPNGIEFKIVEKGCIALNGVSLTISSYAEDVFQVSLIPETLSMTNLGGLSVGNTINIETDVMTRSIASIVEKMIDSKQQV